MVYWNKKTGIRIIRKPAFNATKLKHLIFLVVYTSAMNVRRTIQLLPSPFPTK